MISGNYKKISSFRVVERQQAAAARSRSLWGLSLIAGHAAVKLHPSSCSPAPLAAPGTAGPDCANQLPSCHRRQRGQLRGRRQCQNRCAAIRIGPLLSLVCVLLRLVVDDPQGIWRRTSNWWQRESHRRRCLLIFYSPLLLQVATKSLDWSFETNRNNSTHYHFFDEQKVWVSEVNNFLARTFCT